MTKREAQRLAVLINKHPGTTVTGVRRFPTHGGYSHELVITDSTGEVTIGSRDDWMAHIRGSTLKVADVWGE